MNITIDGDYQLTNAVINNYSFASIYISGVFNGATLEFKYKDENEVMQSLQNGIVIEPEQFNINHGKRVDVFVTASNSGGSTNLNIEYKGMLS